MESDRRLYVTADGSRVVGEGDEDGAFLLVGAGSEIDPDVAEKHKLRISKGKVSFPAPKAPATEKPKAKAKPKAKPKAKKAAEPEEAEPEEADSQGAEDSATE